MDKIALITGCNRESVKRQWNYLYKMGFLLLHVPVY